MRNVTSFYMSYQEHESEHWHTIGDVLKFPIIWDEHSHVHQKPTTHYEVDSKAAGRRVPSYGLASARQATRPTVDHSGHRNGQKQLF